MKARHIFQDLTFHNEKIHFAFSDGPGAYQGREPASVTMNGLTLPQGSGVTVTGTKTKWSWLNGTDSFTVNIPSKVRNNPPSDYVWVRKIEF